MIEIRKINENDAKELLDLVIAVDEESDFLLFDKYERKRCVDKTRGYINKLNDTPASVIFVAVENSDFIGYIAGEQYSRLRLNHALSINIAVKRKLAHAKTGTALLQRLITHAKEKHIHRLDATVVSENRACLMLAKRMGFKIEGIKEDAVKINGIYFSLTMIAKIL